MNQIVLKKPKFSIYFILITILLVSWQVGFPQTDSILPIFTPLKYAENIELPNYRIRHTYKIDSTSFILIGRPTNHNPKNEGLRIIHLLKHESKYKITYLSKGVGESYIYRPTFYRWNNKIIIICELGSEYSWGMDVFIFSDNSLSKIGFINIAASIHHHQESAVPLLQIYDKESLEFRFMETTRYEGIHVGKVNLFYKPGQNGEKIIPPNSIFYQWRNNQLSELINNHD